MQKYLPIFIFLLLVSCAPDDPMNPLADSDTVEDSNMVDTFSVKRPQQLTDAQQQQLQNDRSGVDSIINNASLILNSGSADTSSRITTSDFVVEHPDVYPYFPGGDVSMTAYFSKHLVYPLVAFQNDIKGTVYVKAVIEKDGRIGGLKVTKGLGYGCDDAAMDCIRSMPNWTPAQVSGVNVRAAVVIPVTFGADPSYDR